MNPSQEYDLRVPDERHSNGQFPLLPAREVLDDVVLLVRLKRVQHSLSDLVLL